MVRNERVGEGWVLYDPHQGALTISNQMRGLGLLRARQTNCPAFFVAFFAFLRCIRFMVGSLRARLAAHAGIPFYGIMALFDGVTGDRRCFFERTDPVCFISKNIVGK